jgi:hypothetical protein
VVSPNIDLRTLLAADTLAKKVEDINFNFNRLDDAKESILAIPTADANVTLTTAQQYDNGFLEFTGALTANRDVTFLAAKERSIVVLNSTTGGFSLTCKYPSGGTTVVLDHSVPTMIHLDGTNVIRVSAVEDPALSADVLAYTPSGTVVSTNVEDALYELSGELSETLPITITTDRVLTTTEFTDYFHFVLTGTPSAFTFETPAGTTNKGFKIIENNTAVTATVSVDAAGGAAIIIPPNTTMGVYVDGTDVIGFTADKTYVSIQVTDATETSIVDVPVASGQAVDVIGVGQAIEPATDDDMHFTIFASAKNVGGTTTLTGYVPQYIRSAGAASIPWNVLADADDVGDDLRIRFTGEAAHTINVTFDYHVFNRG